MDKNTFILPGAPNIFKTIVIIMMRKVITNKKQLCDRNIFNLIESLLTLLTRQSKHYNSTFYIKRQCQLLYNLIINIALQRVLYGARVMAE